MGLEFETNDTDSDIISLEYSYEPAQEQKNNLLDLQLGRINVFKAQDIETGSFDVTFDLSGTLLYAHEYIFMAVSSPMKAMISERWSTKDDIAIKIEPYTYKEFFQFLMFLYSGTCEITEDNVFQLVDIAKVFDVASIKNQCDKYLSKMIKRMAVEKVEEIWEMLQQYSLPKSIHALNNFIDGNMAAIIESDKFGKFKRPFLDVLLSTEKNTYFEQLLFLSVVKWAEYQVSIKHPTLKGTDFLDAVKVEFDKMRSKFDFFKMEFDFVIEFVVSKDYLFSTSDLNKVLGECNNSGNHEEKHFKAIYELAEKEALEEQNTSIDENFNLQNVIERKLNEINATIKFDEMTFKFVKEFVVDKAFLFYSKELYEIIAECERTDGEESELFEMLYQLAAKNVETKQSSEEIIDLPNAIKKKLAEYLPTIKFHKMKKSYLIDFAARTQFITHEQAISCFYVCVQINNGGKTLTARFEDVLKIQNCVSRGISRTDDDSGWTFDVTARSEKKLRFTGLKFDVPKSRSPIQQMRGFEWYLLLEKDGILTAKHRSMIKSGNYLIAELRANEEFSFALKQKTQLVVSHNTIF